MKQSLKVTPSHSVLHCPFVHMLILNCWGYHWNLKGRAPKFPLISLWQCSQLTQSLVPWFDHVFASVSCFRLSGGVSDLRHCLLLLYHDCDSGWSMWTGTDYCSVWFLCNCSLNNNLAVNLNKILVGYTVFFCLVILVCFEIRWLLAFSCLDGLCTANLSTFFHIVYQNHLLWFCGQQQLLKINPCMAVGFE